MLTLTEHSHRRIIIALGAGWAITLLFSGLLHAANTWFMKDMPAGHMTSEDIDIFLSVAFETLDAAPNDQPRHWENPKTGAHGDLTPRSTFTSSGMRCRKLEIDNSAGGLNNRSVHTVCKTADGWKVR